MIPEKLEALAASVKDVLVDVILATRDYGAIRKQTERLHDYLKTLAARDNEGAPDHQKEIEEYAAFTTWLDDDNYVFLGYREYDIVELEGAPHLHLTPDSGLGILSKTSDSAYTDPVPITEIPEGLRERVVGGRILTVTKTNAESTVHRPARMDYIGIKKMGEGWEVLRREALYRTVYLESTLHGGRRNSYFAA